MLFTIPRDLLIAFQQHTIALSRSGYHHSRRSSNCLRQPYARKLAHPDYTCRWINQVRSPLRLAYAVVFIQLCNTSSFEDNCGVNSALLPAPEHIQTPANGSRAPPTRAVARILPPTTLRVSTISAGRCDPPMSEYRERTGNHRLFYYCSLGYHERKKWRDRERRPSLRR